MPTDDPKKNKAKLFAALAELDELVVRVGIDSESAALPKLQRDPQFGIGVNPSVTLGEVAMWNEYGTPHIPSRPAFTITATSPQVHSQISDAALRAAKKDPLAFAMPAMEAAGAKALAELQDAVDTWTSPPNAPFTVEMKGFGDPLQDTEQLHNNLVARIEKRRTRIKRIRGKQLPTR